MSCTCHTGTVVLALILLGAGGAAGGVSSWQFNTAAECVVSSGAGLGG